MFKLSKNIQSDFPGRKKCYLYAKHYYTYPCKLTVWEHKNICLRNRIWMAERESEPAVPDTLGFSYKVGIL